VVREEPLGKEPGRAVPKPEEGAGEAEAGGVPQEQKKVERIKEDYTPTQTRKLLSDYGIDAIAISRTPDGGVRVKFSEGDVREFRSSEELFTNVASRQTKTHRVDEISHSIEQIRERGRERQIEFGQPAEKPEVAAFNAMIIKDELDRIDNQLNAWIKDRKKLSAEKKKEILGRAEELLKSGETLRKTSQILNDTYNIDIEVPYGSYLEELKEREKGEQPAEKPKEKETKTQKEQRESLMADFSGITASFEIPDEPKAKGLGKRQQKKWDILLEDAETVFKTTDIQKAGRYDLELRKEVLREYINANREGLKKAYGNVVPAMLNRVNQIKTADSLKSTMEYMNNVMGRIEDREEAILWSNLYDKILKKQLNPATYKKKGGGPLRGKQGVSSELLSTIREIENNLTNKTREEGEKLATQMVEKAMEENRDLTAEEFEKLEEYSTYGVLSTPYVWGSTSADLARVSEHISARIKGEKTKAFNQKMVEQQTEKDVHAHQESIIRKEKPKQKSIYDQKSDIKIKNRRNVLDFIFNANFFSTLNKIFSHEYKTDPEISHIYGSQSERYWIDKVHAADNELRDGVSYVMQKAQDRFKEIFGGGKVALMKKARDLKYEPVEIAYKGLTGEKKTTDIFTQEKMGYAYMFFNNPDMHRSLSGIDPNKSMGGLIKYNPETDTYEKTDLANQIEKNLDPQMKEWAEFLGDFLSNELYDRYNPTYKKFFAFDMPRTKMYMPLFRETAENAKMGIDEMLEEETLSSMGYNRHLYQKKPNTNPIKLMNVTDVFFSYADKMEKFRARADVLQEMKRFFHNPDIVNAIKENYGKAYIRSLNQFLDRYAGLRTGSVLPWVDQIRVRLTRAMIALKPVVMIKQFTSLPAYSMFLPPGELVKGIAAFMANPVKNWKMLASTSYLIGRYNIGFDRDIADAMVRQHKSKNPVWDNFLNWSMWTVKFGDKVPIILGGYAVYNYNYNKFRKQGQDEKVAHENAIREFELATRFTQQASDVADLGFWQSQSSFTKLGTMYMTAPLAYQRAVSSGVRAAIQGFNGRNWGVFRKGVKTAFVGHVLLPTLFQFVANGFELDDEQDKRDLIWAAALGNINNIFAVGDMMQFVIDSAIRKKPWDYQGSPVESIATDMNKAVKEAIQVVEKIAEGEELSLEDYLDAIDNFSKPAAYATGAPWPGIYRSAEGIVNAIVDDEANAVKKTKWIIGWDKKGLDKAEFDTDKKGKSKYR
jgi:hypothetical protein